MVFVTVNDEQRSPVERACRQHLGLTDLVFGRTAARVASVRPMGSVDGRRVSVVAEKSMSTSGYSNTRADQGTPRPDLPLPGVLFGLLWVAAAFASLFYCF